MPSLETTKFQTVHFSSQTSRKAVLNFPSGLTDHGFTLNEQQNCYFYRKHENTLTSVTLHLINIYFLLRYKIDTHRHIYYRPKRSFGQGNVFTGVCHSVNRGEYLTRHPPGPGRYTPQTRQVHPPWDQAGTPPRPGTPPQTRQVHPPPRPGRYTPLGPGRYTPLRTRQVHPPGPGIPPWTRQVHPAPGTRQVYHPRGPGTPPRPGRYTPHKTRQVHPPWTRYPPPGPGRYTPPDQAGTPPPVSSRPRNTVNDRPVRILLECILVYEILHHSVQFIFWKITDKL